MMLLDWMMKEGYSKLKERARQPDKWQHWKNKPAQEGREPKEEERLEQYISQSTVPHNLHEPEPKPCPE